MDILTLSGAHAPRAARSAVAGCCREASAGPDCSHHAVLLTSELVTNALRHGTGPVRLGCVADALTVRVEVGDDSRVRPSLHLPDDDDEGGRGLFLVEALSRTWGVTETPTGKTVWFEVPAQP